MQEISNKELEKTVKCLNECFILNNTSYGAAYLACMTLMIIAAKKLEYSKSDVLYIFNNSWKAIEPCECGINNCQNFEDPIIP